MQWNSFLLFLFHPWAICSFLLARLCLLNSSLEKQSYWPSPISGVIPTERESVRESRNPGNQMLLDGRFRGHDGGKSSDFFSELLGSTLGNLAVKRLWFFASRPRSRRVYRK